jgi:ElaB/YqjD/DUF883 family membrane-anchored ribosome-binding protein
MANEAKDRVRETAQDLAAKTKDKALMSARATDSVIRGNPYSALGIAFGLGILFGFLCKRR